MEELNGGGQHKLELLLRRAKNDGFKNEWDEERPEGEEIWVSGNPLSLTAGTWSYWFLE